MDPDPWMRIFLRIWIQILSTAVVIAHNRNKSYIKKNGCQKYSVLFVINEYVITAGQPWIKKRRYPVGVNLKEAEIMEGW